MFKKTIAIVAALLSSSAEACICAEFDGYLSGEKPMNHAAFMQIWEYFEKNEGLASPNAHKSKSERMSAFAENLERIIEHNKQEDKTYTKGLNKYSDLTDQEFTDYFKLDKTKKADQTCSATTGPHKDASMVDIPTSWDWRDHDGVTPVKNQGSCGSCWTFSAVGALEAAELIKYKTFTPLSEQQLIDCSRDFDNFGCEGGLPSHAFEYIYVQPRGISSETAYPYTAKDKLCTVDPWSYVLNVPGGSVNITKGDEVALAEAIATKGPVSVAFEVVDGFRDYKSGVYSSNTCKDGTMDVNHAVLAVGYGTQPAKKHQKAVDYWIVKNSWGADWGDKGYFKIQRGANMCGIAVCNSYPADVQKMTPPSAPFLQK